MAEGKQVTLFKVCIVYNGKYFSSQRGSLPKVLVKEYKKGETTIPRVGYLFAFKTENHARDGFTYLDRHVILRCKGVVIKELNNDRNIDIIGPDGVYGKEKKSYKRILNSWWRWFLKPNGVPKSVQPYLSHYWGCPPNTVLCSEITPISIVK